MKVIRPLENTIIQENLIIFLAGPIQSAPDWHSDAIKTLEDLLSKEDDLDFVVASPKMLNKPEEFYYNKQVAWESKYLKHADVILFWLANPIPEELDPTRSYAQTTRFEIAEWFGKKCCDKKGNINIVVGIEPGFHGERYIRQRFEVDLNMKVYDNLTDTCNAAVKILTDI